MTKLKDLFDRKIKQYAPKDAQEYLAVAREITQQMALFGLYRAGFSKLAAFHGGSSLRILYNLDRYSEDLDFCLLKPTKGFNLSKLLVHMTEELKAWGLSCEIVEKSSLNAVVQRVFIKETSLGAILHINFPVISPKQKINVKVELDTNPPEGAGYQSRVVDFPVDFNVLSHNIESLFAGKIHAILKRKYIKGRDWFDLDFYFRERANINLKLLKNALSQSDTPSYDLELDYDWVETELRNKIIQMDFKKVKADVLPFVFDQTKIEIWSKEYFLQKLEMCFRRIRA